MRSMTGFGRAGRETSFGRITVEIRSVNHRFLEVGLRLPGLLQSGESALRQAVRNRLKRGKVDVTVRFDPREELLPHPRVNLALLRSVLAQLREVDPQGAPPRPESLLALPGMLIDAAQAETTAPIVAEAPGVLEEALDRLIEERTREGQGLADTIAAQERRMRALLAGIAACRNEVVQKYRERLLQRLAELLGPQAPALDPGRIEQEVAVFADKADIGEECQRLAGHLDALAELARSRKDDAGRPLEFLSQEILREINTIGSKCRDLEMARSVLELKKINEELREQLANVE